MKYLYSIFLIAIFVFLPLFSFADSDAGNTGGSSAGNTVVKLESPLAGGVDDINSFLNIVLNNIVIPVGSIVIVLMIIYTGFLFVIARGNPSKIEDARRMLLYVIIGAAILLGATAISLVIGNTVCQIASSIPGCP